MIDWKKFAEDPFGYADSRNLTRTIGRFTVNFNLFQKYKKIRRIAFYVAVISAFCWILFGFDSTPLQFIRVLYDLPLYFQGKIDFSYLGNVYQEYYGKEMHYSAFVIYLLLFVGLSFTWEKAGVVMSKNMVFSFAGMILAIAAFEFFWIWSFASFQNQPWVATWKFPQMRILLQNLIFAVSGGLCVLYMLTERYHWKNNEQLGRAYYFRMKTWAPWILIGLSMLAAIFWIYYPFAVEPLTVELETGETWMNTNLFPQTLYTVDLNPNDSVNAGVWFYLENDWIHAVNTGVKVLWALTTFYIFRVRRTNEKEN